MNNFQSIYKVFRNYSPTTLPNDGSIMGAVIVPIYQKNDSLFVLLTKRTTTLSTHKGQISFPGGKMDLNDNTLFDCAIREIWEEIGVEASSIELLGQLDQIKTYGSNILLTPFVCKIHYPFKLRINNEEVEEVIEIPFEEFFKEENWLLKEANISEDKELKVWFFNFNDRIVWGATAQILQQFLTLFSI